MTHERVWLVLAGGLSSYSFALFDAVGRLGGLGVRYIYDPVSGSSFEHERTPEPKVNHLLWKDCRLAEVKRFARFEDVDAVFIYGTTPRYGKARVLSSVPTSIPVFYAADTNVAELEGTIVASLLRRISYVQLAARSKAALCLGTSNRLALQALGFRRIVDLPVCAVNFDELDESARADNGRQISSPNDAITLLIIARLVPQKNLVGLISAIATDRDLAQRVKVRIAGEGPERQELERAACQLSHLRVELLGAVPHGDIGQHIAAADALLLPSRVEPWGIVVVEALGMGKPVIASPAVGAALSLAGQTQAVVLSQSVDPSSFPDAIRSFLARRELLTELARIAAPEVRGKFGLRNVAAAHLDLVYGSRARTPLGKI